ncbi:hypothetical protein NDU88_006312 [Pleurodeles waltl]|uniref:Uncharacterized protein n=1 Tax=Pleurodeles waltl TaxID=8319 RepID=A0AAV7QHK1_PLEWA|nr:hypothetical protein NDU88_006312 [Pleurodeles waltl]
MRQKRGVAHVKAPSSAPAPLLIRWGRPTAATGTQPPPNVVRCLRSGFGSLFGLIGEGRASHQTPQDRVAKSPAQMRPPPSTGTAFLSAGRGEPPPRPPGAPRSHASGHHCRTSSLEPRPPRVSQALQAGAILPVAWFSSYLFPMA